ncbi:MAG: Polypeptide-transport-associated domain protein ShlB-type [Caulobacteraceae bacterium]|nr:Polypeptide-transport-associated domain protein ShlB-type [Caulobacteraceae bacterium]
MMKLSLLTAAVLAAVAQDAMAQPAVGAGAQIQQIPPAPAQPNRIPDIRVEDGRPAQESGPSGPRIVVRSLHLTGETWFTEAELIAAADFRPGSELDLAGLRALAGRISDFYNRNGYLVAHAYLPAQDVSNGEVTIAIIEGRYGKVTVHNSAKLSGDLARAALRGLNAGDVVAAAPLNRRLLLLSDLPGVDVRSTLSPGEGVGTSDLLVDIEPGRPISGSLEADNAGSRYTGYYRGGATVNFNEPTGHGDVASLRVLSSGRGLNYARGAYQLHVDRATVGVSYAHLDYRLGREFKALKASGSEDIASVFGSYPLVRSRDNNLYALVDLDLRRFKDKVGATASTTEKSARVATVGLAGDSHDRLWGGGWNAYSANWSFGELNIKTPLVRAIDAATARTDGSYNKLSLQASRLQAVAGPLSFYALARGQIASKNLDSSEKMELGGAYGVRAYPEGEAYGDQGYLLTVEARLALNALSGPLGGQAQAIVFADQGSVLTNKSPWAAGSNRRTLSAAGVGLTWADGRGLMVKASYAFKLGDQPATSAPDRSGRAWVQLVKFF